MTDPIDDPVQTPDEIIETAVGQSIEAFAAAHPQTYKALRGRLAKFGGVDGMIIHTLKNDAGYVALLAKTESEMDRLQLVKTLVPLVLRVVEAFLGML